MKGWFLVAFGMSGILLGLPSIVIVPIWSVCDRELACVAGILRGAMRGIDAEQVAAYAAAATATTCNVVAVKLP